MLEKTERPIKNGNFKDKQNTKKNTIQKGIKMSNTNPGAREEKAVPVSYKKPVV